MNCSEFSAELQQLVENRSGCPPESLLTHIGQCSSCRQQWRDHLLVEAALQAWIPVTSVPSLVDGVLDRLVDSPVPAVAGRSDRGHRWSVVAMVAPCLFIVVGIGLNWDLKPGLRPLASNSSLPQNPDTVPKTVEPVGVASSVVAVLEDLRLEYDVIAEETRASARELAVAIPAPSVSPWGELMLPESPPVNAVDRQRPDIASPSQGAVSMIGLSIGSQIGEAMDFLRVAVPDGVPRG